MASRSGKSAAKAQASANDGTTLESAVCGVLAGPTISSRGAVVCTAMSGDGGVSASLADGVVDGFSPSPTVVSALSGDGGGASALSVVAELAPDPFSRFLLPSALR